MPIFRHCFQFRKKKIPQVLSWHNSRENRFLRSPSNSPKTPENRKTRRNFPYVPFSNRISKSEVCGERSLDTGQGVSEQHGGFPYFSITKISGFQIKQKINNKKLLKILLFITKQNLYPIRRHNYIRSILNHDLRFIFLLRDLPESCTSPPYPYK